ncbi:SGNH/GDSL hydrolase family protein [Streptomyces sp. NPDC056144]|uniref:SGNH/GDSL hydrolase family protein n=1 Tax=unclassified Streptomyces TaxID=2593676 RepID=UPI0035D5B583
MSARARLTPQMQDYEAKFTDGGDVRWLPYLMYFHPAGHRSTTVNTDSVGFRYATTADGRPVSVADHEGIDSVRLLAGSSTVFGIGAAGDDWTLPSRLTAHDPRPEPWLNFGGRSFNSTQELLLLTLYRHLLPKVEEIVLFSGFNNLGLARQPQSRRGDHGAFFNAGQFFDALPAEAADSPSVFQRLRGIGASRPERDEAVPSMEEQLDYATDLTLRHLRQWQTVAKDLGAKLTYVLQPLAGWVRPTGSPEEEEIFAELDAIGGFTATYGDILRTEVNLDYAARIETGAKEMGVGFVNLSPVLADAITDDQWLFVDRIHFNDEGHDFVARKLLQLL